MKFSLSVDTPHCNVWLIIIGFVLILVNHTSTLQMAPGHPKSFVKDPISALKQSPSGAAPQQLDEFVKKLETSLLRLFGMQQRPSYFKSKKKIPQFMYDLYHQLSKDNLQFSALQSYNPTIWANTVRSFYNQDKEDQQESLKDHNHVIFSFNVSLPILEELQASELRIFSHFVNDDDISFDIISEKYRIEIYDIIRPASRTREAITRLVDTRIVNPKHQSFWESFDVYHAVLKWRHFPHLNFGLEVKVTSLNGEKDSKFQHVRLKRSVGVSDSQWSQEQPILVTYSHDADASSAPQSNTRKRRSSRHRKHSKNNYNRKKKQQQCKRHDLYVDFSDVGWDDWIVAPPGYHAFYCHGECDLFPLPEYINTTNHAIVQSLVHSVNPKAVPLPCCVPTQLSHISMLYLDEYEKVVLKRYENMVVEGCGCR